MLHCNVVYCLCYVLKQYVFTFNKRKGLMDGKDEDEDYLMCLQHLMLTWVDGIQQLRIHWMVAGCWRRSQLTLGERRSYTLDKQPFMFTFTPTGS